MTILHIDRNIAGAKTLWILRFSHDHIPVENTSNKRNFPVEFLIPSPFGNDDWLVVNDRLNEQAIESLCHFQKMCTDATTRCINDMDKVYKPGENPIQTVSKEIENLSSLIDYYNQLMKKFKLNDPPDADSHHSEDPKS